MAVQVKTDLTNKPFVLSLQSLAKDAETVLQDGGRSGDMLIHTLMSFNPTSQKWVPFSNEAATNGEQFPRGILMKTLTEAEIQAGDVLNVPILIGEAIIDSTQLVIESSKTLNTVINQPANINVAVEEFLRQLNIYTEDTIDTTEFA